jgi:hypothetical protein
MAGFYDDYYDEDVRSEYTDSDYDRDLDFVEDDNFYDDDDVYPPDDISDIDTDDWEDDSWIDEVDGSEDFEDNLE